MLRADSLSLYRGSTLLLSGFSVSVPNLARTGIIGPNGVGKSTLLQVLANQQTPTEGSVIFPPGLRISYLPEQPKYLDDQTVWQIADSALTDVRTLESELRAFETQLSGKGQQLDTYEQLVARFEEAGGYLAETNLKRLLTRYDIYEDLWQYPAKTLSGGQQMRLALATTLARHADLLCLDEPSNHLDIRAVQKLSSDLAHYPGTLILVSHDRALLDALCTQIWHLEAGSINVYEGNYSSFTRAYRDQERITQKRQRESARLRQRLERDYHQVAQATNPKKVHQRKSLERKLNALSDPAATSDNQVDAWQLRTRAPQEPLLHAQDLDYTFDSTPLFSDISFVLARGDRIVLMGPNGSGKSTLLKLLAGHLEPLTPKTEFIWHADSKVFYLEQQTRGLDDTPVLQQLTALVSVQRAESLLALVNLPKDSWQASPSTLSGGERARAAIALLIASESNVLLLDEPTNALDIATIELLENALISSQAALMLVTHDQRLAERVATQVWQLEAGQLTRYAGGYAGFRRGQLCPAVTIQTDTEIGPAKNEMTLERLEDERTTLADLLSDPFRFSEREYARMQTHYQALTEALMQRYDAMLPEAAPRFRLQENIYSVWADTVDGTLTIGSNTPAIIALKVEGSICHLNLRAPEGSSLTLTTYHHLINLLTRLAFWYLDARAVQHQSSFDLSATVLHHASDHWWLVSRSEYEREQGYIRKSARTQRRKGRRRTGRTRSRTVMKTS
jgi:ATP-binding cassette subfamily F protein 3